MNSNSILTSNLLDIIFENRNKDYGAYVLRKDYNKRLFKSLVVTLSFVAMLIFLVMFATNNVTTYPVTIPPIISPTSVSAMKTIEPEKKSRTQLKPRKSLSERPVIVVDDEVQKKIPINPQIITSTVGDNIEPPFEGPGDDVTNIGSEEIKEPVKILATAIDKTVPVNSPDILPQFPGGIKELIKFLKRNLNTPQQLEEGEEIAVRVRFIVNFSGDLMGFDVIETGGEPFDNEVIRVLKKMPKWIPGKASGENVSTYFIIPVKFRVSD